MLEFVDGQYIESLGVEGVDPLCWRLAGGMVALWRSRTPTEVNRDNLRRSIFRPGFSRAAAGSGAFQPELERQTRGHDHDLGMQSHAKYASG